MKILFITLLAVMTFFSHVSASINEVPGSLERASDTYVLKTGVEGKKTLDLQHEIYYPMSKNHLERAGLSSGQTVWDIGCGSGTMTKHIAEIVGETGHVYSLDISPEQIKVSRDLIEEAGFRNVSFYTGDITTAVYLPVGMADIVYGCFVLMHQTNPKETLRRMMLLLKPGGILVLQESEMRTMHFSSENSGLEDYVSTIVNLGFSNGVDFNIGPRLSELCEEIGYEKVDSYQVELEVPTEKAAPVFLARMEEFGDKMIEAQLATLERINGWKAIARSLFLERDSLSSEVDDSSLFYPPRQFCITAVKTMAA